MSHFIITNDDPIWEQPEAEDKIDALSEQDFGSPLEADHPLAAFYSALTERWPELDDVPDDKLGDIRFSPWTDPIVSDDTALMVSIDERALEAVLPHLLELAAEHDLRVLDVMEGGWVA